MRAEDTRCVEERRVDVARHDELDTLQTRGSGDRLNGTPTTVGRRRSADTDDDLLRTEIERGIDEFADTRRRRVDRVVAFGTAGKREPGRGGHLDDRDSAMEAPLRIDGLAERTGDALRAVRATEHGEGAFTTVGERDLDAVVTLGPTRMTDGRRHLGCGGGAAEFVDCRHDPHAHRLNVVHRDDA